MQVSVFCFQPLNNLLPVHLHILIFQTPWGNDGTYFAELFHVSFQIVHGLEKFPKIYVALFLPIRLFCFIPLGPKAKIRLKHILYFIGSCCKFPFDLAEICVLRQKINGLILETGEFDVRFG